MKHVEEKNRAAEINVEGSNASLGRMPRVFKCRSLFVLSFRTYYSGAA